MIFRVQIVSLNSHQGLESRVVGERSIEAKAIDLMEVTDRIVIQIHVLQRGRDEEEEIKRH